MKRLPIFTTLFFLPLLIFSQMNTSLDFVGGVDIGYRNLRTSGAPSVVTIRNITELSKVNFRVGFNFNKKIANKIYFKTGLRFANVGYKNKEEELRFGDQVLEELINPGTVNFSSRQLFYNYLFLEIPIVARYEFSQKRFKPYVELGVAPSLFLKSRNKLVIDDKSQILDENDDLYDYNKVHFVSVISIGGSYAINESLQIFAQPTFRYHLTKLIKDVPVKENLWNCGLEIGLRKGLN